MHRQHVESRSMYAATRSPTAPAARSMSNLYSRVGVETAVDAASPHRLVALLFDGFIEAVAQARGALRSGDLALKARAIGRAVRIVDEGLKAALNARDGGTLATDLDALYAYVALRLTQANLRGDAAALDECQGLIEPLRAAWSDIAARVDTAPR